MFKFPRLQLSAVWLLLLLQRTPLLRVAANAAENLASSRIVALLKSAFALGASLGAVHSLAGATQFVVSNSNVNATVGSAITPPIAFTVTGAAIPAGSFRVTGLPPGVTVPGANASGIVNGSSGTISGTPTTAGNFTVSVLAYEFANAAGDTFGPAQIGFRITSVPSTEPAIATQPASQSVNAGATATFSAVATGSPAPTYLWRHNGVLISGATNSTLVLANVTAADAGAYTVTVSNAAGVVTSSAATLTVISPGPTFTQQPQSQHVSPGATVTFAAAISGTAQSFVWKKDNVTIPGATGSTLTLANASAADMGFYAVTATNATGSSTSSVATLTVNTGGSSRLVNVSTRGYVPPGGALIPGFVLQGRATKALVIRAVGPTLGSFGVGGTLADPVMDVIPLGESVAVASNDNWGGFLSLQNAFTRVGAFPLAAGTSTDASVETSLNSTGASGYTVRITSKNAAAAGIALAEVYDQEPVTAPVRLVNVSTSGFVGTGEQALVPGFVIAGDAAKLLLIRAVGPGLEPFGVGGVLADPQLSVVPLGKDLVVVANDNWGSGAALQAAFTQAGAFGLPTSSNDAAVIVRLPPGGYTVVVSGVAGTTGTALVEIYDLDP